MHLIIKWFRGLACARQVSTALIFCSIAAFGQTPEKDYNVAEQEVRDQTIALRSNPQKAILWYIRGGARLKLSDPVGALADFSEAIRLAPFDAGFRLTRAQLFATQERWPEVVADTIDGLSADPGRVDLLVLRAHARRSMGALDLALSDCNKALVFSATNIAVLSERAWVYSFQSDWGKTLDDATSIVKLAPNQTDAVMLQGIARRERHEWPEAIDRFSEVIRLEPKSAVAWLNRGRAQAEKQMWNDASNDLCKAIELDPGMAAAYEQRGRVRTENGDLDGAVADLSKDIQLRPNHAEGYLLRAVAYERQFNLDAATADANAASSLGANDARLLALLARADERRGDWKALQQHAQAAIDLQASSPEGYR